MSVVIIVTVQVENLYYDGKKSMNRVGHAPLVVLRLMAITLAARYQ